ncbi:tyrosine-type recombinase/integrase [Fastidiosibacter lacustris]|uniref:tyrosine-type recombinase/integrase n=1 Tax=Fastidiosibacter lacustris TaxID=2056695 RepID=UPI001864D2C7|nr:tyrosine-type recombinase/integrase [Fastidiosibacter lacustris]
MPKLKLTKTNISELEPTNKIIDYFDSEVNCLVLRVFPSGAKTFSIIYRNSEKKQKRYTIGKFPTIPLPVAKKEAQRLLLLVSQGQDIQKEKAQHDKLTLKNYLDRFYLDWSKKNHRSYKQTHHRLLVVSKSLHNMLLNEIDLKILNNFLFQYKSESNVSDSTLNKTATVLKGAISRAVEFGYLQANKLTGFKKFKESSGKIRYLSSRESEALLTALDGADKLIRNIVTLAYYTGMRRGEIFTLKWSDIDLKTNQITLDKDNTKSGHARSIPMHKNVRQMFLDICSNGNQSGLVFKSPITGGKLDNINKSWITLMKKTEIDNFRFHDLRHNFASQLIMKGESLSVVRELLGHSDFKMTLRYAHLAPEHRQKAVDLL